MSDNKKPAPLYKENLDEFTCDEEGCDCGASEGLFLTPRCHPNAGVDTMYRDGKLHVTCHECEEVVTHVAVASLADRN